MIRRYLWVALVALTMVGAALIGVVHNLWPAVRIDPVTLYCAAAFILAPGLYLISPWITRVELKWRGVQIALTSQASPSQERSSANEVASSIPPPETEASASIHGKHPSSEKCLIELADKIEILRHDKPSQERDEEMQRTVVKVAMHSKLLGALQLQNCLRDNRLEWRLIAYVSLRTIADPSYLKALIECLRETERDPSGQRWCVEGIGQLLELEPFLLDAETKTKLKKCLPVLLRRALRSRLSEIGKLSESQDIAWGRSHSENFAEPFEEYLNASADPDAEK